MQETSAFREQKSNQPLMSIKERINVLGMILEFDDIKKKFDDLESYDQAQIKQWLSLVDKLKDDVQLDQLYQQLKNLMIKKLDCPSKWFTEANLYQIHEARIKQIRLETNEPEELDSNAPPAKKKFIN